LLLLQNHVNQILCGGLDGESSCFEAGDDCNCQAQGKAPIGTLVGADCRNNICASGLTCIGGQCENTRGHKLDEGNECKKSSNCKSNRCLENRCVEREEIHHRLRNKILGQGEACDPNLPRVHNEKCANGLVCSLINKDELGNPTCVSKETHHDTYHSNKLIGGDPGSKSPSLGNIGGGPGSTYDPTGSGNGFGGGGTPSPPSSPSPSPGGGGKKSSDLPLILGIIGGSVGLVIVLAIAYLIVTKRLKL